MDKLIDELVAWNRKKAAKKAQELLDKDTDMRRESVANPNPPDLSDIDPVKLKGLYIRKEFDGFGLCKGIIRHVDNEIGTNRTLFTIEYVDGDREDLFLSELLQYLHADEVYAHTR